MVFDRNANPAYIHTPENVEKWIRYRQSSDRNALSGYSVRIGTTMRFMSVEAYLTRSKIKKEQGRTDEDK